MIWLRREKNLVNFGPVTPEFKFKKVKTVGLHTFVDQWLAMFA